MRSAFGAGSLDGVELESVEDGVLLVLDDGVLLDGVLDIDGDALCGGVVAPGLAVGLCCSVAGAPCAGGELLLSVVCA